MLVGPIFTIYFSLIVLLNKALGRVSFRKEIMSLLSLVGFLVTVYLVRPTDINLALFFMVMTSFIISILKQGKLSSLWVLVPVVVSLDSIPLIFLITLVGFILQRDVSKKTSNLLLLSTLLSFLSWIPEIQLVISLMIVFILLSIYLQTFTNAIASSKTLLSGHASATVIAIVCCRLIDVALVDYGFHILVCVLTAPLFFYGKRLSVDKVLIVIRTLIITSLFTQVFPILDTVIFYIFFEVMRLSHFGKEILLNSMKLDWFPFRILSLFLVILLQACSTIGGPEALLVSTIISLLITWRLLFYISRSRNIQVMDLIQVSTLLILGGLLWQ